MTEDKVIIACPNPECQQKLNLPKTGSILSVTCPICKTSFQYPFTEAEEETEERDNWKVMKADGKEYGPIDLTTLRQWVKENRVVEGDWVFDHLYDDWFRAKEIRQLSDLFEEEVGADLPVDRQEILQKKIRWYHKGWFVIPMLLFIPPLGFIFLWSSPRYETPMKIGLTLCFGLWMIGNYLTMPLYIEDIPSALPRDDQGLLIQETYLLQYRERICPFSLALILREGEKPQTKTSFQIASENKDAVVLIQTFDKNGNELGQGSGFILSEDGLLTTNHHVIANAYSARIKFIDGDAYEQVFLVVTDRFTDLAVLKVDGNELPYVLIGNSDKIKIMDDVIAIGNPLGFEASVSKGTVGGIRDIDNRSYIQFDASISMGSSGGALFDKSGRVVGITTLMVSPLWGQGLNFAIPINELRNLISKISKIESERPAQKRESDLEYWKWWQQEKR